MLSLLHFVVLVMQAVIVHLPKYIVAMYARLYAQSVWPNKFSFLTNATASKV